MDDYSQRLKHAMDLRSVKATQLSDALRISYQAVKKAMDGKSTSLSAENNSKAAAFLKVNPDWLATGKGQIEPTARSLTGAPTVIGAETNAEQAPILRASRRVPIVGEVKGGEDGYLEELQYPVGHGDGFVEYWCRDDAAYAVRVRGDSMHPRYRAGEFVVVTPGIEAQTGSDVVVSLKDGRKLLKELNWQRDGEVQLLSINGSFAPLTLDQADILFIHRVAGSVGRDAFIRE